MRAFPLIATALGAVVVASAPPAFAWGPEGHTVTARVATAKLDPTAAQDLLWIIQVGIPALNAQMQQQYGMMCQIDPADPLGPVPDYRIDKDRHTNLANWPDCYRFLNASTQGWHFNDIPLGQIPTGPLDASAQAWCAQPKSCASQALADNLHKLAAPSSPADAAMAMAFVVHFVGDMHQPLHEETNDDTGGNDVLIALTADSGVSASKLHELWDSPLVEAALGTDLDVATQTLQTEVNGQAELRFNSVDGVIAASDGWAEDAHKLAEPAYSLLNIPVGAGARSGVTVSRSYVETEKSVVKSQLVLAAIRLRAALNAALTWAPPS